MKKILIVVFVFLNLLFISPSFANEDPGFTVTIPSKVAELEKFPIIVHVYDQDILSSANHIGAAYSCKSAAGGTGGVTSGVFFHPDLAEGINYNGEKTLNFEAVIEPFLNIPPNIADSAQCNLTIYFREITFVGTTRPNGGYESKRLDDGNREYFSIGKFRKEVKAPFEIIPTKLSVELPQFDFKKEGFDGFITQFSGFYNNPFSGEPKDFTGVTEFNFNIEVQDRDYDTFVWWLKSGQWSSSTSYPTFEEYFKATRLTTSSGGGAMYKYETIQAFSGKNVVNGLISESIYTNEVESYHPETMVYGHYYSFVSFGYTFSYFTSEGHHIEGRIEKSARVAAGDEEKFHSDSREEFDKLLNSISFTKVGERIQSAAAPSTEPEGDCEKEPSIDPKDVSMIFKIRPELTKNSIRNAITETSILRAYVTTDLTDKTGNKIETCDIKEPGLSGKSVLQAEFTNDRVFAGFTGGNILDVRQKTWPCEVDISSEGEFRCTFIIAPNDVKKIVGQVGKITETITLKIGGQEEKVDITLTPAGPSIKFNIGSQQLQQDSVKSIRFTVDDSDSKISLIKVKLLGPGSIFQTTGKVAGGAESAAKESAWLERRSIFINGKPGVEQEVGYKAPPIGNFDIGSAINSLSMVDLQTAAGKQILKDAALAYGEEYFQNLEDIADSGKLASDLSTYEQAGAKVLGKYYRNNPGKSAGKFKDAAGALVAARKQADNLGLVAKAYKAGNGMYTLSELPGGIEGTSKSMGTAAGVEEGSGEQTTSERIANVGVYAIDIAQMGVSILTYVPNKIPGVSKISAGLKTSFSAATNIWKANFQYWAQAEKIDRAKELFVPVKITVKVGDESGWETTYVLTLKVAYHQVK